MPYKNPADHNAACLRRYYANKEKFSAANRRCRIKNIKARMLHSAKNRAIAAGIPFDITVDDFEVPTHCPIFPWIELAVAKVKHNNSSPSLDRIVCEEGYVKGNVHVISNQANRYKNNGSLEELVALGDWAKNVLDTRSQTLAD